ncbi:MAG: FkbM family methyltransferase [Campylobacteraceae bacterium]|nr:FkbM family methyltransferase [Campylobacteraceae bacterium]
MNLEDFSYINIKDKSLVDSFIFDKNIKKYILGINKFTKAVQKHIEVDGIIDDFSRVQKSRKKSIYQIEDIPKDALILCTVSGSPLEVINKLDELGYKHFNYLAFIKYSNFELRDPDFIMDFKEDYKTNKKEYLYTYNLLEDDKSREVFKKVINFKITFDFEYMRGFTNNHEEQYFDRDLIPDIKNINFIDGGAYVGDTLPSIIKNFPDYNKIYCFEPNNLHINIAKRDFDQVKNIEFINCGLGSQKISFTQDQNDQNNCAHDYQASNINSIDNLISSPIDFIKLDIEGAELDALIGAKETILKHHPILAICIYHKASDWYKIPKCILDIRADYKIHLRHYMEGIYETVMYFIPNK